MTKPEWCAWCGRRKHVLGHDTAAAEAADECTCAVMTKPEPNPLEEALAGPLQSGWEARALVAIRVLMAEHSPGACSCVGGDLNRELRNKCAEGGHKAAWCQCSYPWPCPVLERAAKALKGEA